MAVQFPNFLGVPVRTPDYSGIGDLIGNYYAGRSMPKNDFIKSVQAEFAKPIMESDLEKKKLDNIYQGIINQFSPRNYEMDLENKNLKNIYQRIVNQFTPEDYQSQFESRKALDDYRKMGGGRAGVTSQQQLFLQQQLMKDNPNFTPEQAFEAAGNLVNGDNKLNDGTPFNVSGLTKLSADKAVMQGTTSSLVTQAVKSNQADAELKVLDEYAQRGLAPYGDTILGMNPDQVIDTFKTDDKSQKKLGRFVASQALQYEAAQNRIRLANGQPGVTSTEELMKMSGQLINSKYPRLSYNARQEAARYMDEALEKGLQARNRIGLHPSSVNEFSNKTGAKLLAKDVVLPKFNSQKDFVDWYRLQPKVVQDAVKIKLGGS